jgi:hypothetical protein
MASSVRDWVRKPRHQSEQPHGLTLGSGGVECAAVAARL